ncbi:MAG: hypothetical protein GX234_09410 [Clostridiales bacterium]|nr:hypothetical protein [Clostridiales bacterium]
MAKQNNIKQYRKPININLGMIIFGVIFVYIVIGVFLYFTTDHIIGYEVQTGSLAVSNIYKGLALREEEVIVSDASGYVNYYAREGERVGCGNLVYAIDESGKISEMLGNGDPSETAMTDSDLTELKTEIVGFCNDFSREKFSTVYDFKYNVQGTVLKLANYNILSNLNSLDAANSDLVDFSNAPKSGIISYSTDGYENKQPSEITAKDFETENYTKTQLVNNALVSKGDPVYRLSLSEDWSIIIPVEEERLEELVEEEYVKVKFLRNQQTSWAKVKALNNSDGTYAELSFNNSMITFCTDRFVDIELITNDEKGLKIPNSAIVEKEFYLVPFDFVTQGGKNNANGVLRQSVMEDGSTTTEFTVTQIYSKNDTEYYLDDMTLRAGDVLIKPNSTETFTVGKKATLIGVYNINKGYADFKQIIILYRNDQYSIVQSGTDYGLSAYDHIVLEAETVNENDLIYE